MRVQPLVPALPLVFVAMSGILLSQSHEAPETFRANAHVAGGIQEARIAHVGIGIHVVPARVEAGFEAAHAHPSWSSMR